MDKIRRLLIPGIALASAGGIVLWRHWPARDAAPAGPPSVTVLDDRLTVPEFRAEGTQGALTRASLLGRWTMLFFGYTHCPDVCPTTLATMAEVVRGLDAATRPQVLFVSVDPERDTAELLAAYVPKFDPAFIGARGRDEDLAPLLAHLGVMVARQPRDANGQYGVDHTASMFLIDPKARLKAAFGWPHDPARVRADYLRLTRR